MYQMNTAYFYLQVLFYDSISYQFFSSYNPLSFSHALSLLHTHISFGTAKLGILMTKWITCWFLIFTEL